MEGYGSKIRKVCRCRAAVSNEPFLATKGSPSHLLNPAIKTKFYFSSHPHAINVIHFTITPINSVILPISGREFRTKYKLLLYIFRTFLQFLLFFMKKFVFLSWRTLWIQLIFYENKISAKVFVFNWFLRCCLQKLFWKYVFSSFQQLMLILLNHSQWTVSFINNKYLQT